MKDFAGYEGKDAQELLRTAQAAASQLDGKGEGELLRAIYARAAQGKRAGTLTNEQIDAFCAQLAPLLDGARRKKLERLVRELKEM